MTERQSQMAERVARQARIDHQCVEPTWRTRVDIGLVEMCFAVPVPASPVVLLPELRIRSLLQTLLECFPRAGKMMIVDAMSHRFEALRSEFPSTQPSLYFSAQDPAALTYSTDIFDYVVSEIGLATLSRSGVIFPEYRRVLKPGGAFIFSVPLAGSFPAYFDILEECLMRLCPAESAAIMASLQAQMQRENLLATLRNHGFIVDGQDETNFSLSFQNVEQLLFSTLVESHFLGFCLGLTAARIDARSVLTLLVRAFHHYFQGEMLTVPMRIGQFSARKQG